MFRTFILDMLMVKLAYFALKQGIFRIMSKKCGNVESKQRFCQSICNNHVSIREIALKALLSRNPQPIRSKDWKMNITITPNYNFVQSTEMNITWNWPYSTIFNLSIKKLKNRCIMKPTWYLHIAWPYMAQKRHRPLMCC